MTTGATSNAKILPLEESLVMLDPATGSIKGLRGNRCSRCKRVYFPARQYCAKCCDPIREDVLIKSTGRLAGFSLVNRKPPFALITPPYIMGEVDTGQGMNIVAVIRGTPAEIRLGAPVELGFERIAVDGEGGQRLVYVFNVTREEGKTKERAAKGR